LALIHFGGRSGLERWPNPCFDDGLSQPTAFRWDKTVLHKHLTEPDLDNLRILLIDEKAVETLFGTLKNTLGGMDYHFWSQYLNPASRRPKKNDPTDRHSEDIGKTRNTLAAIEKFVNVQLLVLGTLQRIAKAYPAQVKAKASCWLRAVSASTPSEFVTRIALSKIIKTNLDEAASSK